MSKKVSFSAYANVRIFSHSAQPPPDIVPDVEASSEEEEDDDVTLHSRLAKIVRGKNEIPRSPPGSIGASLRSRDINLLPPPLVGLSINPKPDTHVPNRISSPQPISTLNTDSAILSAQPEQSPPEDTKLNNEDGLYIPEDIMHIIINLPDLSTLAKTMRVSRSLHKHITPKLYTSLEITKDNADLLFAGFPRTSKKEFKRWKEQKRIERYKRGKSYEPVNTFDSEDENEDLKKPIKRILPDLQVERRKLDLFKLTTTLIIKDRLPTHLCRDLLEWIEKTDSTQKQTLFPLVENFVISANAVRQWAFRQDTIDGDPRTYESKLETDPFITLLNRMVQPRYICITLPEYTKDDLDDYLDLRASAASGPGLNERWIARFKKVVEVTTPKIVDQIHLKNMNHSRRHVTVYKGCTGR